MRSCASLVAPYAWPAWVSSPRKRSPGSVATLVKEHHEGRRDWSNQIWQLLTLELWQRAFVDRG